MKTTPRDYSGDRPRAGLDPEQSRLDRGIPSAAVAQSGRHQQGESDMNEAQFLLGLGFRPRPDLRGTLSAPPIVRNVWKEHSKWFEDREMGGLVRKPGTTYDEAKP